MKLDNTTIREAVNLWFEDQNACIESFGHISNWDTSDVTDMNKLFQRARLNLQQKVYCFSQKLRERFQNY